MIRLFLVLLLLFPLTVQSEQATPSQLQALRERIQELQQTLADELRQRDQMRAELRRTERRLGELSRERRTLVLRQKEARQKRDQLQEEQEQLIQEQGVQLDWLAKTVRASYMTGREPLTKLLLNQQQPDQVARLLRYQEYFQRARNQRLSAIERDLARLEVVTRELQQAEKELKTRQVAVERQATRLEDARIEREQALQALAARVQQRETEISNLEEDAARLDQLLQDMNQALSDIPANPMGRPFAEMAGNLPWPVTGERRIAFGTSREGGMRWNGVLLAADEDTPIRAIYPGRIVFADWLSGYGLMTILDHGDSFLSIYGHAQSLLRDVGDWVNTGDVLALAGNSGGARRSGVYFEIRQQGSPLNPDRWCSRRVTLPPLADGR